jgi:hypothetical protein
MKIITINVMMNPLMGMNHEAGLVGMEFAFFLSCKPETIGGSV